jgi:hypothetical protein
MANESQKSEKATLIPLDEVLKRTATDSIALLKIDAEGSEVDILSLNTPDILSPVQRVAVEYHDRLRPGALRAVQSSLYAAGFSQQNVISGSADNKLGLVHAARKF